jgi:hypothetical protein
MDEDALQGEYTIFLNGQHISRHDFQPIVRYGYRQLACDVRHFLRSGANHLAVQVEVSRDQDGLRDPLYLSGPFGVTIADGRAPVIDREPYEGIPQSGLQDGYPYYAGTLSFTHEIMMEKAPSEKTFTLVLNGWQQPVDDCVEVMVNGRSLGVCCWSPYRWDGTSELWHAGLNTVELRITKTAGAMLDGVYFDGSSHRILPIAKSIDRFEIF